MLVGLAAAVLVTAIVLGPGSRHSVVAPTPAPTSAVAASASAAPTPTASAGRTLIATQDGLTLTAVFDRTSVEPGGRVNIDVTVVNNRTSNATYLAPCPGAVEMNASVALPLEPAGTTWAGLEADFKAAALGTGGVTGDSPTALNQTSYGEETGTSEILCSNGVGRPDQPMAMGMSWKIRPGETFDSRLVWTAELESGVPALP